MSNFNPSETVHDMYMSVFDGDFVSFEYLLSFAWIPL